MLSVRDGDQSAFAELVKRFQKPLINYFYRFLWDPVFAEDCAQEVFIKLFTHAAQYEPKAKFTTYMYKIAHNHLIDKIRSRTSAPKTVSLNREVDEDAEAGDFIPSNTPSPPEELCRKENADIIRKGLDKLPEQIRSVVILSETQQLSYDEIAEVLGIPLGTVKSRLHYGMEKLKVILYDVYRTQKASKDRI